MRENQLAKLDDIKKIARLKTIKSLTITANPISDEMGEGFKFEVLILFPYFVRINKVEIQQEDRDEAVRIEQERIAEVCSSDKGKKETGRTGGTAKGPGGRAAQNPRRRGVKEEIRRRGSGGEESRGPSLRMIINKIISYILVIKYDPSLTL